MKTGIAEMEKNMNNEKLAETIFECLEIARSNSTNTEVVEKAIAKIYSKLSLPKPKFLYAESPISAYELIAERGIPIENDIHQRIILELFKPSLEKIRGYIIRPVDYRWENFLYILTRALTEDVCMFRDRITEIIQRKYPHNPTVALHKPLSFGHIDIRLIADILFCYRSGILRPVGNEYEIFTLLYNLIKHGNWCFTYNKVVIICMS